MHRYARPTCFLLLATFASATRAELFCVETAAEFSGALTVAGNNHEHDEIRLRKGTYSMADGVYFDYNPIASENFDLEISGGWYQRGTAPCGAQSDNPWETVLDGEGTETVLRLASIDVQQASVTVRLLTFMNGFESFPGVTTVGGLDISWWWLVDEGPTSGTITIERNVFLINEGDQALSVNGGFPRVANNLFLMNGNQSSNAAAACLATWDLFGSTFTNNTVIGNDGVGVLIFGRGEVVNNNFWDNGGADVEQGDSGEDFFLYNNNHESFDVANSAILEDNVSAEPEYQRGLFNYTPVRGSPLVDAGRDPQGTLWHLTDVDINDSPRRVGAHVDIGAFENEKLLVDGFEPQGPF
jgi:hypothetical protein